MAAAHYLNQRGLLIYEVPDMTRNEERVFTIGTLSRRTNCNIETIRYYEKIGVMPKPARSPKGHRRYDHELQKRLFFIRRSRELGFSLKEVRSLLDMVDSGKNTCDEVKAITLTHHAEIRKKIADLRKLERVLKTMADQCDQDNVPACPVIDALFGAHP